MNRSMFFNRRGATAVEYLVAIILVILVSLAVVRIFGDTVREKFEAGHAEINRIDETPEQRKKRMQEQRSREVAEAEKTADPGYLNAKQGYSAESSDNTGDGDEKKGAGAGKKSDAIRQDIEKSRVSVVVQKKKKKAGFNPVILVIILLLVGGLIFIMIKGNKN